MSFEDMFQDDRLPIYLVISVIFVLLFAWFYFHYKKNQIEEQQHIQELQNLKKPIETHSVRVVSKRMHPNNITAYVVFEYENGERKEFTVSIEKFRLITENDKGILKNRGTKFISFDWDTKDEVKTL